MMPSVYRSPGVRSSCKATTSARRTSRSSLEQLEARTLLSAAAQYVVHVSVDGLTPDVFSLLDATQLPNFYKLRREGAVTDNARTDFDYSITLPNHTDMLTGRPVTGDDGHGWTTNTDPAAGQTLHSNRGAYIPSVWDVVHDQGLRTGLFASKTKFSLYETSYDADTASLQGGAPDANPAGGDNGRDKIDRYFYDGSSSLMTDTFTSEMASNPFHYSLIHFHDPDTAGHAYGWLSDPQYLNAVRNVDLQLGKILNLITTNPTLRDKTTVILTADHGGEGTGHSDATDPQSYTIPFYVWGAGVTRGADLYQLNWTSRANPGTGRPDYTVIQPVRDGDVANLALDLLSLPPVPGSMFNARQDLVVNRTAAKPFTLVVLPDTQYYVDANQTDPNRPKIFDAQTQWIASRIGSDNIVFVTHVGDIVQNGATYPVEWQRADASMDKLDGDLLSNPDGLVAYSATAGNHDYDLVNDHASANTFVEWFGPSRYQGRSWYGGSSADGRNHYQVFTAGGRQYLHLNIQWEAPDTTLSWAQGVITAHPNMPTMLTTHAYIDTSGSWSTERRTADGNSGQQIFQELVQLNPQIFMVFNGHFSGEARKISTNNAGSEVYEMLANYQSRANGGDGFLRVATFRPDQNRVDVKTYSPWLNQYETDADSQFSLDLNFSRRLNLHNAPTATLTVPRDNGPQDLDTASGSVTVTSAQATFRVSLADVGLGVDDASVRPSSVRMLRNGVSFTKYSFAYDASADAITLIPDAGSFASGDYEIYINDDLDLIRDLDGYAMDAIRLNVRIDTSAVAQQTVTFQQGVNGYNGTVDTFLQQASSSANNATAVSLNVDSDDPAGSGSDVQTLLRFDNIFGSSAGQIPAGSTIVSAAIELQVTNGGNAMNFHRMIRAWSAADTWSSTGSGIQTDGVEAVAVSDRTTGSVPVGKLSVDVTTSLQAWLQNPAANRGWVLMPSGSDGVDFDSSEGSIKPRLIVKFTPPQALPEVTIAASDATASEHGSNPGQFTITRSGNIDSDLVVTFSVGGTASSADYSGVAGFSVTIPAGSAAQTIDILAIDDLVAEADETLILTLTAGASYTLGASASASVTLLDDEPRVVNQAYATDEDGSLTVDTPGLLAGATDADGDSLTAVRVLGPSNGTLVLSSDGSFLYTPNAHFNGIDRFTFVANDGLADSSPATVTLTIRPVDDPTQTMSDAYALDEDQMLSIGAGQGVLANDIDIDNTPLAAVVDLPPAHGSLTLNTDGSFSYTPNADYAGTDTFWYVVRDGAATSAPVAVTLTVRELNEPPVARDDQYAVTEDTVLTVNAPGLLSNDVDAEGDPLTAVLQAGPSNGTVTVNADGSFTYTPVANFYGTDSFTYRAQDAAGGTLATVTVAVNPVNDLPLVSAESYTTLEDVSLNGNVLSNDSDPDGDDLNARLITAPSRGTLAFDAQTGQFTYTPAANASGPDSFIYRVNDGIGESGDIIVDLAVTAVNDAPRVANPVADVSVPLGTSKYAIDLSAAFSDIDDASLALSISGNSNSSLVSTILSGTTLTLTFAANVSGTARIAVRGTDAAGAIVEDVFNATVVAPTLVRAVSETKVSNSSLNGNFTRTTANDGQYQVIKETSKTPRILEHRWTLGTIPAGNENTFFVQAFTSGETFRFEYSANNEPWRSMLDVTTRTDSNLYQNFLLPAFVSGSNVQVRVIDLDRSSGDGRTDSISIDDLYVRSIMPAAPATVSIIASDATAAETGANAGVFTITRTGDISRDLLVQYSVGGTASGGTDYSTLSGTLTIKAGETSASFSVVPINDTLVEGEETVIISIMSSASYVLSSRNSDTVRITDDDA